MSFNIRSNQGGLHANIYTTQRDGDTLRVRLLFGVAIVGVGAVWASGEFGLLNFGFAGWPWLEILLCVVLKWDLSL